MCTTCTIEVTEETALLNDFICPECEEVYELSDDSELIEELKKKNHKNRKRTTISSRREKY